MEDYSEYIIQGEPDKRERVRNWMTAIGLQDVDDLKPSQYFLDTVRQNIEGKKNARRKPTRWLCVLQN